MNWYLKVIKQYADFNSRARRTEFWMFALFNALFMYASSLLDRALGFEYTISLVYAVVLVVPILAVGVRRLHDIGKSGWLILIGLIPVIGYIWLIVLFTYEGKPGVNKYGANPKEINLEEAEA